MGFPLWLSPANRTSTDCDSELTAQNFAYKGASALNRLSTSAWFRGTLALVLLMTVARPAESQSPTQRDLGQSVESVDRLSREDYADRQQATLEMWKRRDDFRDTVQRAARHRDPEIAGRANWILRQWRRGALPDTPPHISRLLQQSDHPEAVDRLLEAGQFAAAVVAVEESAGTIDHESIQRRATAALLRRFPIYVHLAIEHEALRELLQLVDLVAVSPAMAL